MNLFLPSRLCMLIVQYCSQYFSGLQYNYRELIGFSSFLFLVQKVVYKLYSIFFSKNKIKIIISNFHGRTSFDFFTALIVVFFVGIHVPWLKIVKDVFSHTPLKKSQSKYPSLDNPNLIHLSTQSKLFEYRTLSFKVIIFFHFWEIYVNNISSNHLLSQL